MDGKSPEIVIADSLVAIANALERIADGQAQISSFLLRIADASEAKRSWSVTSEPGDCLEQEEW